MEENLTSACRNDVNNFRKTRNKSKIRVFTRDLICYIILYKSLQLNSFIFSQEYPNLPRDAIIHNTQ